MGYQLATEMYDFDTGVWFKGYYDPWEMAPYQGFGISFGPNGAFTWVMGSNNADAGCKSYSIDFMKGSATVQDANTIRFRETQRWQRYHSTCDPSLNYDRDASGGDFTMDYVLGATQDTGLPTLRLYTPSDGTGFDYFKG